VSRRSDPPHNREPVDPPESAPIILLSEHPPVLTPAAAAVLARMIRARLASPDCGQGDHSDSALAIPGKQEGSSQQ
jgi:hypothetical protein